MKTKTYHVMVHKAGGLSHVKVEARNYEDLAGNLDEQRIPSCDVRLVLTSSEYWKAYDRGLDIARRTESHRRHCTKYNLL